MNSTDRTARAALLVAVIALIPGIFSTGDLLLSYRQKVEIGALRVVQVPGQNDQNVPFDVHFRILNQSRNDLAVLSARVELQTNLEADVGERVCLPRFNTSELSLPSLSGSQDLQFSCSYPINLLVEKVSQADDVIVSFSARPLNSFAEIDPGEVVGLDVQIATTTGKQVSLGPFPVYLRAR